MNAGELSFPSKGQAEMEDELGRERCQNWDLVVSQLEPMFPQRAAG